MISASDTDNTIEENEIVGNVNGIFLAAGVQGNTIRGNTIAANPPVQVAVDHSANAGFDIKNMADAGANIFQGNVCATSINAPCPSVGTSLTANPNPIPVTGGASYGMTTISWNAPDAHGVEIHIGSPNGPLFAMDGNHGSAQTGVWVSDGTTFYLQDVTGGKPLISANTLATVVVRLQSSAGGNSPFQGGPHAGIWSASPMLPFFSLCAFILWRFRSRWTRVGFVLSAGMLMAQTIVLAQSSPAQKSVDKQDKMIAAGRSPKELAQYVFDTHGCKTCHTLGHDGKLGLTAKGKERAQGFEGCINMLTAMTVIVQIPEDKRSPQQRQKAKHFEEFGCTDCHKLTPGKLGLTEVGAKLAHLHVGCVEVEKLVASAPGSQR